MTSGGFFRPRLVSPSRHRATPDASSSPPDHADRFRVTMLPHMDAAYNFALFLTRDRAFAEDIVQEAFLRAFRGFAGWRGDNSKAWLLAIVRHCHIDAAAGRRDPLRGAEAVEKIDDCAALLADTEPPGAAAERESEAAMLHRTISALPEPFREVLILRELEELSYKEIAAITRVPIGTVMSRLARARTMLAELLLPPDWQSREARL